MNSEEAENFASVRRALKFCSLLLLGLTMVHIPNLIVSLSRVERAYEEMLGADIEEPWILILSRFLQNYFFFIAAGLLIVFIVCVTVTARSKGGGFLYLNINIVAVLAIFNGFLLDVSQKLLQVPIDVLMVP